MEAYKSLLTNLGVDCTEEGDLLRAEKPVTVQIKNPVSGENKRKVVVLPTKLKLKQEDQQNHVFFHPMGESLFRGNSEILKLCIIAGRLDIAKRVASLIVGIATLAADEEKHAKVPQFVVDEYLLPVGSLSKAKLTQIEKSMASLLNKQNISLDGMFVLNVKRSDDARPTAIWDTIVEDTEAMETFIDKLPVKSARSALVELIKLVLPAAKTHSSEEKYGPAFTSFIEVYKHVIDSLSIVAKAIKPYVEINEEYVTITSRSIKDLQTWYEKDLKKSFIGNIGCGKDITPANEVTPQQKAPKRDRYDRLTEVADEMEVYVAPQEQVQDTPTQSPQQPSPYEEPKRPAFSHLLDITDRSRQPPAGRMVPFPNNPVPQYAQQPDPRYNQPEYDVQYRQEPPAQFQDPRYSQPDPRYAQQYQNPRYAPPQDPRYMPQPAVYNYQNHPSPQYANRAHQPRRPVSHDSLVDGYPNNRRY